MDGGRLLGIALLACAPAPSKAVPAAPAEPAPADPAPAVEPAPAEAPTAADEAATPTADPLAGLDADQKWQWALARMPELASLTLAPTESIEFPTPVGKTITLHSPDLQRHSLDAFPYRPCTPLQFLRDAEGLFTRVPLRGGPGRPDLRDDYAVVVLGSQLGVGETFSDGIGGDVATANAPPKLTEANARRLRYHGRPAAFAVVCAASTQTRHCRNGGTSTCRTCTPTLLEVPDPGGVGGSHSVTTNSPCEPCPPEGDDVVAILNDIVHQREFLAIDKEAGPSFFRSASDCKAAKRGGP